MDTANDAAQPGGAAPDIVQVPPPAAQEVSARDAARSVVSFRLKAREGAEEVPAPAETRSTEEVSAAPAADAPPEKDATAEAGAPAAEAAPIEPPRSWSKEAREKFETLPRETQSYLVAREAERENEARRSESAAATERAALEAERAKAEAARANYEQALPSLVSTMQQQLAADFSDVRSIADVERLAREDWPRYVLFDAQQKRIAQVQSQAQEAGLRQNIERELNFQNQVQREQGLLIEKNPELADPVARAKLTQAATGMLYELGFTDRELGDFFRGRRALSLHDHRVQMLIRDGVRFREAQKAAKQASAQALPPVQRPGAAQHKGAAQEAAMQNLTRRLDQTGNLKDAARLLAERRKATR